MQDFLMVGGIPKRSKRGIIKALIHHAILFFLSCEGVNLNITPLVYTLVDNPFISNPV
jgi:hypothetical protein